MSTYRKLDDYPPPPKEVAPGDQREPSAKWKDAVFYSPDEELKQALELAIALRQPLLLTGAPGSGKTMAAYWAAWRMGLAHADLEHVQIRSDANASDLKYQFDAVRYYREYDVARKVGDSVDRRPFILEGPLWRVFAASHERRVALLFDEIDKAPRDFPNDLLHELDVLSFSVPEIPDESGKPTPLPAGKHLELVVMTSNAERDLPDAFLRRCLHHEVVVEEHTLRAAVARRIKAGDIGLGEELAEHAIARYLEIRTRRGLRHKPGFSELLVWLRALALSTGMTVEHLKTVRLDKLRHIGALIKDPVDNETLRTQA